MDRVGIYGALQAPRPKVLVWNRPDESQMALIFELADAWGWDLIGHEYLDEGIPPDLTLSGALITGLPDGALAGELRRRGCPAVRLGRLPHPGDNTLPVVLPDQAAAGRLAADHFVERRFKELGIVSYHASNPRMDHHALWSAFCEHAQELGVRCHSLDFHQQIDDELSAQERLPHRAKRLAAWLSDIPKPVGLFATGDEMALAIWRMCEREGIRVPEAVALLGGQNGRACRLSTMRLSSIDMGDLARLKQAMRLLKRLMAGERAPTSPIMVPPQRLVERRSTDVLAVSDPLAGRALTFIWDHIQTDPSVDDVANALEIPRRTLERRFRQAVGCGVKGEIMRRRLQVYCRLLRSSDEPIVDLAVKAGYQSQEAMHRHFKKAMGTSPHAYRRANRGDEER